MKDFIIRDAEAQDKPIVNELFSSQNFPLAETIDDVRIACDDNGMIGALLMETAPNGSRNVKTIVVTEEARGKGVGKVLMQDALSANPDLRLVSRGVSVGFYEALGLTRCDWSEIDPQYRRDCDGCEDLPTCNPVPFRSLA